MLVINENGKKFEINNNQIPKDFLHSSPQKVYFIDDKASLLPIWIVHINKMISEKTHIQIDTKVFYHEPNEEEIFAIMGENDISGFITITKGFKFCQE